jgi:glycosyltransferase involved in cell wall biosynthesis
VTAQPAGPQPTGPPVLHVITTTQRRGAEVLASELARELDEHGWTSALVALAPGPAGGIDAEVLGERRLDLRTLRTLRSRMSQSTVVVAHGSSTLPACALAGAGVATPAVYRSVGDPRFWAPTRLKRSRTGLLMRRMSRVVALTDEAAAALQEHYRLRADQVTVIPKGVDSARLPPKNAERAAAARARLDLPSEAPVALYLGSLSPEKNVAMAIDATALLPDLVLLVAGAGPDHDVLAARAERSCRGRVRFLGQVRDPVTALTAADLLVLPSHTEGMPGVAMEAGMVGLPVVATDVGWVRDIVLDGTTGVLVPPGETGAFAEGITAALTDCGTWGSAARAHCLERFDMRVIAVRWSDVLDGVR